MLNKMSSEFRKFFRNCENLKAILRDTQITLEDVKNNLFLNKDIKKQLFDSKLTESLQSVLEASPSILIFGQNSFAKAIFVNIILGQPILPNFSSKWRWVKFLYGFHKTIRLTLGNDIEIVEKLKAHDYTWVTIPFEDLERHESESPLDHCPTIEVELSHCLLKENLSIVIPPDCTAEELRVIVSRNLDAVLPVIIYIISSDVLSDNDIQEIKILKEKFQDLPIIFVTVAQEPVSTNMESMTESEQHLFEKTDEKELRFKRIRDQLVRLGYLNENNVQNEMMGKPFCSECSMDNNLIGQEKLESTFVPFVQEILKSYLLKMSLCLSEVHNNSLKTFILTAFDMAREIQITPRRITYAQDVEMKLYIALMHISGEKQEEITKIIQITLQEMKQNVDDVLESYSHLGTIPQSIKLATMEIHHLVLRRLSASVASQLVCSIVCLQDSFTGTLQRCLESLEKSCQELEGNLLASDAVKQILSAAYNIDLKSSTKFTVVHTFLDKLLKLVQSFQLPWTNCVQPKFDRQWQVQVVNDLVDSLSASKLAKTICLQFQEHIKSSHEIFKSAMRNLENQLSGKLEQTEEQRIVIRKRHAPRFARLALESTSLCDLIRHGMPKQAKEIGRGQYGVVFSCEPWGNVNPCAVKSVVPPDERHWNDLAMEFYYTRTIPEHPRIVKLRGSVIDKSYGAGNSPAVLLVMERMTRDLHCGLNAGLSWTKRIQIAIDVVEGIRYLHSQGLVHRDIKIKNVLLDQEDRAKLTDFGFCISEAMMSGSIVGTPVHMAPELLSGRYDSSVDVYAFGILFWFICSGQVKLPYHFEQFHNKEQLWTSVRKGIRPECLPKFSQDCWNLMEQCWAAEPVERPLLGYVLPQLEAIQQNSKENQDT